MKLFEQKRTRDMEIKKYSAKIHESRDIDEGMSSVLILLYFLKIKTLGATCICKERAFKMDEALYLNIKKVLWERGICNIFLM